MAAEELFEKSVGLCEYAGGEVEGFQGIHKQRYSDFIVREVYNGQVCRLNSVDGKEAEKLFEKKEVGGSEKEKEEAAAKKEAETQKAKQGLDLDAFFEAMSTTGANLDEDKEKLSAFLQKCVDKNAECEDVYFCTADCSVKAVRTALHQTFREHARDLVETDTQQVDGKSKIRCCAIHMMKGGGRSRDENGHQKLNDGGGRRCNKLPWPEGVGNHLQFTLLKENVDTMTAVNFLCRQFHLKNGAISFAGTKDKRAITAQKCTV